MNYSQTDWVVVFIAAFLKMVIGFFWYSKWLFGSIWERLIETKCKKLKNDKMVILWTFLISLTIAFFINFFAMHLNVTTVSDGVFLGFCIWLGFVATKYMDAVIWEKRPLKLFAITTCCDLLSFMVMGGVIGA